MSLRPGDRIGAYQIAGAIAAGGMGEVYRATDSNLKRQVAIKVLPDSFAGDAERIARFQREAEVLAQLNHPNIAHIHGLERSGGTLALVMELVEGEDLAQRLARGPMPLEEALPIAKQIVDALSAAHDQGVVHRDLKPANIKVRDDGTVKVLDFGLAKMTDAAAMSNPDLAQSPTITTPAFTQVGVILGTAAYMSPEQARGRHVDKRADIWAFGCVLFEMLTGARPFKGDDLTDTLAAIVKDQPDLARAPAQVRRLLTRCLEKDPRKRLRDIGDAWDLLDVAGAVRSDAAMTSSMRGWIGWGLAGVLAIALLILAVPQLGQSRSVARTMHLSVPLPNNRMVSFFAISPDARSIVFTPQARMHIRSLETGELHQVTGADETSRSPFWSPDSRSIAFVSSIERKLKVIPASGGTPQTLCEDVGSGSGGDWSQAGTIVFGSDGAIKRVPAAGGPCTEVIPADPLARRLHPRFLPDGDHFLFLFDSPDEGKRGIYVASLQNPAAATRLLSESSTAEFAADDAGGKVGRLLFVRGTTLMAIAFNASTLTTSGEPMAIAPQVSLLNDLQIAASAADDGTIAYLRNSRPDRQLVYYDRAGAEIRRVAATAASAMSVTFSPDGAYAAFNRVEDRRGSVWVDDVQRAQPQRLTKPPFISRRTAVWSPDSRRLVFAGLTDPKASDFGFFLQDVSGDELQQVVKPRPETSRRTLSQWSGTLGGILYSEAGAKTSDDVWLLPMRDDAVSGEPVLLLGTAVGESQAQTSPDGKWLAYASDEGLGTVFLRPISNGVVAKDRKWQVSPTGSSAAQPLWRADSKELYYLQNDSTTLGVHLLAVAIGDASRPVGTATKLFEFETVLTVHQANVYAYAAAPDGRRFVVDRFATDAEPALEVLLKTR